MFKWKLHPCRTKSYFSNYKSKLKNLGHLLLIFISLPKDRVNLDLWSILIGIYILNVLDEPVFVIDNVNYYICNKTIVTTRKNKSS